MRLLLDFSRAYPGPTLLMLASLFLAGLAEGVSLTAMLPLLSLAMGPRTPAAGDASPSDLERMLLDGLSGLGLTASIGTLLALIFCAILAKNLLVLLANSQIGYTAARVTTDLRLDLLRAMLDSRWAYFLHHPAGKLVNGMATEAGRAATSYMFATTLVALAIQSLVYAAIAFLVSWQAALVALGAALIILLISQSLVALTRRAGKRQTELLNQLMARLSDTLQSVKPLKAMAREALAGRMLFVETCKLNKALRRQTLSKAALASAQEPMFMGVLLLGMFFALDTWEMPLSTVLVLVVVLSRMLNSLGKVQRQYQKMLAGESAYWSLRGKIDRARGEREALPPDGETVMLQRGVELRGIGFRYGREQVLKELSLDVEAGRLTALVGPSGAGKTTVIDLIIGLFAPDEGEIRIDGVPLGRVNQLAWRRSIGYVPQEHLLLHDTILHNVTLGDTDFDEEAARRALREAGALEFVENLPEGIHSLVGERGASLSGGQRQRIVIARALVHRPRLLILDEATSALDPAAEASICETLRALRGEVTILAISHQRTMVEVADRVYRIDGGVAALVDGNGGALAASPAGGRSPASA